MKKTSLFIALISLLGLASCNKNNTSTSSIIPTTPASSNTSSSSSSFDDWAIEEQITYLEDFLQVYSEDVVSSQTEDAEALYSYSNGALEIYSKSIATSTLYLYTNTNVITTTGSIQYGEDTDIDKTITTYVSQKYHDSECIYLLTEYSYGEKTKSTIDYTGKKDEMSLQFIPSVIAQLESLYNFIDSSNATITLECEEGDTFYFGYKLILDYSGQTQTTQARYDLEIKNDKIESIRYAFDDIVTVSSITQKKQIVSDLSFKYETITQFTDTLFNPTDFTVSEDTN